MTLNIKFSLLLSLFLTLAFFGCKKEKDIDLNRRSLFFENPVTPIEKDSLLKVATYNIKLGFKLNDNPWDAGSTGGGMEQLEALADVLREIDADIIALQEVPRNRSNSQIKNYIEELAKEMKMNYAYGSHGYNDAYIYPPEGEWGIAFLTKFEILDAQNNEVLYEDEWTRRSVLQASIKMNDVRLLEPYSLHWYPKQVEEENTSNYIAKDPSRPIVMGDFNRIGPLDIFAQKGLEDVDPNYMLHGVDRIFVRPYQFEVLEIGVINNLVSDHLPSWALLKVL